MKDQKQTPGNILDLRQVIAEQELKTKRQRQVRFKRRPKNVEWHEPRPLFVTDWRRAFREWLKFMLTAAVVGLVIFGVNLVLAGANDLHTVNNLSVTGINNLSQGLVYLNNLDQKKANLAFHQAAQNFEQAQERIDRSIGGGTTLVSHLPYIGARYQAAKRLISATNHISQAGILASTIIPPAGAKGGFQIDAKGIIKGTFGWLAVLSSQPSVLDKVQQELTASYADMSAVQASAVPVSIRSEIDLWQKLGPSLLGSDQRFNDITKLLFGLVASADTKNYLFIFQNNDELRASGGFPGTYALVKFDRGAFTITDAPGTGPYALRESTPQNILPPEPLLVANPFLTFQDAGWFIDQRYSAAAFSELYRQARGIKPDGVLFFTPNLIEKLLTLTGPITIASTNTTVTAENFVQATEQQVEYDYDKNTNAPKQMLTDMIPELLKKLTTLSLADALKGIVYTIGEADAGNMTIDSLDQNVAQAANNLAWDGAVSLGDSDFIGMIDENVGGGKTDRSINVATTLTVNANGNEWDHELVITRQHNGKAGNQLTGKTNRDYIRVLVPAGANLDSIEGATILEDNAFHLPSVDAKPWKLVTDAEGTVLVDPTRQIRVTHETGGTVFGFWSVIDPGSKQTITVKYRISADKLVHQNQYQLLWRHQPGSVNRVWTLNLLTKQQTFKPATPASGWVYRDNAWSWTGYGDWSQTLSGIIKVD